MEPVLMDLTIILTILGIIVAIVIGIWQIILTRKQIQHYDQGEKRTTSSPLRDEISVNTQKNNSLEDLKITNTPQVSKPQDMDEILEYYKRPFPEEIVDEIEKLSLYQQEAAKDSYFGLRVQWEVKINSVNQSSETNLNIMSLDRGKYPWVVFDVDSNEYPEIKSAKEGEKNLVFGEI